MRVVNKRGQVWVETVVYTLIAFIMIGLVLGFAKPKIEELQDKAILEQSLDMMKTIDRTILEMGVPGNKREIEVSIKKGSLQLDGINERLIFEMESHYIYSEPGIGPVEDTTSGIFVTTEKKGKVNLVNLTKEYFPKYNITYQGKEEIKSLTRSASSYKIIISNKGGGVIDITLG